MSEKHMSKSEIDKAWSKEEVEYLMQEFGKQPAKDIAKKLGKGKGAIIRKHAQIVEESKKEKQDMSFGVHGTIEKKSILERFFNHE